MILYHEETLRYTSGAEDGVVRVHKFDSDYFSLHEEYKDLEALKSPPTSPP